MKFKYLLTLILLLSSLALARVEFQLSEFQVANFRDFNRLQETCSAPAASSFWCERLTDTLTFIPTKGVDFFFNDAGELVAVVAKEQKGMNFMGRTGSYNQNLNSRDNLVPISAAIPGSAVLLDGNYEKPENVSSSWERLSEAEFRGIFNFELQGIAINKTLTVSNISHTMTVELEAVRLEEAESETLLQYAMPGIGNISTPYFKIGQGITFSLNPLAQAVDSVTYASVQSSNRGNAGSVATILRPHEVSRELAAQFIQPNIITMQSLLGLAAGEAVTIRLDHYNGKNELVRYYQEDYKDLAGLFQPNILGQTSLGVLWVLEQIHSFIPNWGISIIILTMMFRVLVWPLISVQTRSMFAMQRLQPKMQELQKKYKDNREKLTQETMKLYQTEKVNPAMGCLPAIVQMPLFIILWRVFVNFEFNEGFLWIPDLGQPDPIYLLPILYVGIIFAQSYFLAQGNPASLRQQLLINAIFIIFIINFPAGVTLYWVSSMLVQVFQYWLIKRSMPPLAPATAKA